LYASVADGRTRGRFAERRDGVRKLAVSAQDLTKAKKCRIESRLDSSAFLNSEMLSPTSLPFAKARANIKWPFGIVGQQLNHLAQVFTASLIWPMLSSSCPCASSPFAFLLRSSSAMSFNPFSSSSFLRRLRRFVIKPDRVGNGSSRGWIKAYSSAQRRDYILNLNLLD